MVASKHHGKILQGVLEEMGSEWTIHTSSPGVSYHGTGATPIPESRHVIGTARMGDDPATSVVDRWGRVHSLDNVVIADSSVFVTSSGYGAAKNETSFKKSFNSLKAATSASGLASKTSAISRLARAA